MNRNPINILLFLILIASVSFAQTEDIPTKEQIQNLSNFRGELLRNNKENLLDLDTLLKKFTEEDFNSESFSEMISKTIINKHIDHFSSDLIVHFFEKDYPNLSISDKITVSDINTISKNNEILEMILTGVINPEFPFPLGKNSEFFKELSFYEIKKGDKIGEVGAGLGGFALLLAIVEPEIELSINEISNKPLWYSEKKFNFHSEYIDKENIEFVLGDKKSTNFEEGVFDKIYIRNSFHHFKKKKKMLNSIKKSLKEDGHYIYSNHL